MKILHTVQDYLPSVGGMQEVVRQLSERLVKLGHDVTVATSMSKERISSNINGVRIVEFDITGNAVRGYLGNVEIYRKFLLAGGFDVITNFAAQQWTTDLALPLLDHIRSRKVFVPTGFSGLYWPQYAGYFSELPKAMKKYDMNVFLSDDYRDINFARANGISKTTLIPNGAGADEFRAELRHDVRRRHGIPDNHFFILLVGSHTGVKGHGQAVSIFHRANIRNATFMIIANGAGGGCTNSCRWRERIFNMWQKLKGGSKSLLVRSLSREETVSAYHQADLFLFPSMIECSPIVLFECMASRTPFLATNVGNAAEIADWSGSGLILPTRKTKRGFSKAIIGDSAKILESVHADVSLRESLQASGYKAWQERFTWEAITARYESIYSELFRKCL